MQVKEKDIETKIKEVINNLRPYLQNDGGDVAFKKYENGVVYVSLTGACSGCPMAAYTLQDGIESVLIEEIPEVIKVVNEN
jgi:Fe-S cluster biogenesis protein NfuA